MNEQGFHPNSTKIFTAWNSANLDVRAFTSILRERWKKNDNTIQPDGFSQISRGKTWAHDLQLYFLECDDRPNHSEEILQCFQSALAQFQEPLKNGFVWLEDILSVRRLNGADKKIWDALALIEGAVRMTKGAQRPTNTARSLNRLEIAFSLVSVALIAELIEEELVDRSFAVSLVDFPFATYNLLRDAPLHADFELKDREPWLQRIENLANDLLFAISPIYMTGKKFTPDEYGMFARLFDQPMLLATSAAVTGDGRPALTLLRLKAFLDAKGIKYSVKGWTPEAGLLSKRLSIFWDSKMNARPIEVNTCGDDRELVEAVDSYSSTKELLIQLNQEDELQ